MIWKRVSPEARHAPPSRAMGWSAPESGRGRFGCCILRLSRCVPEKIKSKSLVKWLIWAGTQVFRRDATFMEQRAQIVGMTRRLDTLLGGSPDSSGD